MKGSSAPKERKRKGSKATAGAKGKAKRFKRVEHESDNSKAASDERALGNHVILSKIFDYVSAADLISFRLVNKTWNDVAATSLIKRKDVVLTLDKRFIKGGKPTKKAIPAELVAPEVGPAVPAGSKIKSKKRSLRPTLDSNMAALNVCIERSEKFACTVLRIGPGNWNFEHENMDRFFDLCGSKIKVLELNLNFPQPMKTLQTLFLDKLPNIEYLNIRSVSSSVREGSSSSVKLFPTCQGPVYLPSLNVIRLDALNNKQMFQDLLAAAVNLKRIESCSIEMVGALEKSGKGSALKGFSLKPRLPHPFFDYSLYSRLAALQPNLERLVIWYHRDVSSPEDVYPIITNALAKILKSSSSSLKILDLRSMSFISQIELSKFPVLPSLEAIYLGNKQRCFAVNIEHSQRIFPRGLVLKKGFPNLKKVVFRMQDNNWRRNFPEDDYGIAWNSSQVQWVRVDPIPTVEILVVESDVVDHELALLYAKFPNIKQLTFINFNSKRPLNNAVWKTPAQVESIEFNEVRFNMNLMSADSFFTGFRNDICENLQRLKRDPSTVDIELLEVMPSIRNVKNLKRLKVAFTHRQNSKATTLDYFQKKPFISEVTGLFGFSKIPGLDVVFSYDFDGSDAKDIARTFEPLKPYVQFSNEKFKEDNEDEW